MAGKTSKRIFFTGGTGKAGRHVIRYLLEQGHRVLNADKTPLMLGDEKGQVLAGLDNILLDVTDSGQVFNALAGHASIAELRENARPLGFDAVVHFAAVPRVQITPDNELFRVNTLGTYHVIEAALALGINKIVIASSETVYGLCFSHGQPDPVSLPVEETDPPRPMDSYALSKVVNEQTARAFHRRSGADIYALRLGNVIEPDEYHRFGDFCRDPAQRLVNAFNYIDARDLGQAVDLCLARDGLGFEIFNVSNDQNSVDMDNPAILEKFYPDVPLKRPLAAGECLYSNRKIRDMLGFAPVHDWHRYYNKG